jgi:hypothetical protein
MQVSFPGATQVDSRYGYLHVIAQIEAVDTL